jgi:hypothetical protein
MIYKTIAIRIIRKKAKPDHHVLISLFLQRRNHLELLTFQGLRPAAEAPQFRSGRFTGTQVSRDFFTGDTEESYAPPPPDGSRAGSRGWRLYFLNRFFYENCIKQM